MLIAIIIFLGAFVQAITGFGSALVAMPLLTSLLGIQTAAPLFAVVGFALDLTLLWRFRAALNLQAIRRLVLSSLVGIPLGVIFLRQQDPRLVTALLGVILVGYALYALITPRLLELRRPAWGYLFGLLGGILGGAYNTSGPPVVVFATCRRWPPAEFRGNLQAYFIVNSAIVMVTHAVSGNLTPVVWRGLAWAIPGLAAGLLVGLAANPLVHPQRFRQLVLLLLLALGARLIFSSLP